MLSILHEKYRNHQILKGHGIFYVRYRGEEIRGKGVVLANKQGSFRLEILGPFLQPLYVITHHEGETSFLSLRENRLYRGVGGNQWHGLVTPFLVDPSVFLSFIFGELPVTFSRIFEESNFSFKKIVKGAMDKDNKLYYLEIPSEGGMSYHIWVDPVKTLMVKGSVYNSVGEVISSLQVKSFEEINGEHVPKSIRGEYDDGIVLKVDFESISFMESVRNESFQLSPPEGVEMFDF